MDLTFLSFLIVFFWVKEWIGLQNHSVAFGVGKKTAPALEGEDFQLPLGKPPSVPRCSIFSNSRAADKIFCNFCCIWRNFC